MKQGILLVRRAYGLGGAEIYNLNLAKEIEQLGYRPIICTQQAELRKLARQANITVINPIWLDDRNSPLRKVPPKLKYALIGPIIVTQYLYYLLRFNIRGLYIQTRDDQIFGTIAARLLRRRSVWADHGDIKHTLRLMGGPFLKLYFYAMRRCDGVVCVAKKEEANISALLPAELRSKLLTIHNGVSRKSFDTTPKKPSDREFVVGSSARVQHEKGIDYLVQGFAEALPQLPTHTKLHLAGVIDHQDIVELVDKLGLSGQVTFDGGIPNDQMAAFLKRLDVYVFPSLAEVFPLSILEAMMSSRTIIATNVGGIPEEITDHVSGLLVDPKSSSQIARALVELSKDKVSRQSYAEAAHAKAIDEFDFSQIARDKIVPLILGTKS